MAYPLSLDTRDLTNGVERLNISPQEIRKMNNEQEAWPLPNTIQSTSQISPTRGGNAQWQRPSQEIPQVHSPTSLQKQPSRISRKPVGSPQKPNLDDPDRSVSTFIQQAHDYRARLQQEEEEAAAAERLGVKQTHSRAVSEPLQSLNLDSRPIDFDPQTHRPAMAPPVIHLNSLDGEIPEPSVPQLQYHHELVEHNSKSTKPEASYDGPYTEMPDDQTVSFSRDHDAIAVPPVELRPSKQRLERPNSAHVAGMDHHRRGRSLTPGDIRNGSSLSPARSSRNPSMTSNGVSPDGRPLSSVDLLNIPHSQQVAQQNISMDNARLRNVVGSNASLLDTKKTLDMYRVNVKKTNDPAVQYEFAIFMINVAQETVAMSPSKSQGPEGDYFSDQGTAVELIKEARHILQKLADKSYVFAQYYLADGYASGLFNKGKEDYERAFPLFVSAGKHGHAEAGYRAGLCYEFGWGCRRDFAKAVLFYRQAASKYHPGAATRLGKACLVGDLGLHNRYREGVKWMKRAQESADHQHNSAPYELGLLHLTGYGDDLFKDESYAAQLFTQAAELGHPEANLRMGEAYERGLLSCPKDPALSIHFYTGAAQAGVARAMMALCAWYMVGAEPVLEKNEAEAYEWAKQAAETGYAKAEYAVGYFTEMGIGCRRDPLEANVWYVRAADQGDERAKQRLAIIRSAETGDYQGGGELSLATQKAVLRKKKSGIVGAKDDKDCVVM